MNTSTSQRVLAALEADYSRAQDNANRARRAFGKADLDQLYGESGRTKGEHLRAYETEEADALKALKDFAPNWAPRKMFSDS